MYSYTEWLSSELHTAHWVGRNNGKSHGNCYRKHCVLTMQCCFCSDVIRWHLNACMHARMPIHAQVKTRWPRITLSFTRVEPLLAVFAISLVIFQCFHNSQHVAASGALIIIGCGLNSCSAYKRTYLLGT